MTLKELYEKRNKVAEEIRKMADICNGDDARAFNAEEEKRWEAINKDYNDLTKQIDVAKRADEVADQLARTDSPPVQSDIDGSRLDADNGDGENRTANPDADLRMAISAWAMSRANPSLVTDEHLAAARRMGIDVRDREFVIPMDPDVTNFERRQAIFRSERPARAMREARALSTQIGQSVGFTIAPNFNAGIESALLWYGPMAQVATPIRTTTAADYPLMTDNETSKTGSYSGENTAVTTTEDVTIRQVVFGAYKATTNAILVPFEAFRDSAINLQSYLSSKLGERLGRFTNTEMTTGAVKCKGIVTGAVAGITSASSTAIQMDEVLSLIHSIDKAYRDQPGFGVMFHDDVLLALRKLKDGNGQYLWTNGTQAGEPDLIWGKSILINNDMASTIESGAVTMLAGLLSKYYMRTVGEIRMTMTDQRYWEYDQVGFAAYMYFDGGIVDAGTNPIKKLTQV